MLNKIKDNIGARRKSKALGRGIGSGKGKTSARGGKGQTARSGVALNGFEGGQMPLYRRLPKRGFVNPFSCKYEVVNLDNIQEYIDLKLVDANDVSLEKLIAVGALKGHNSKLKVLGTGELKQKTTIKAHAISKSALAQLEKSGSKFEAV